MVKQSMRSKPFRGVSKQENSLENLGEDQKEREWKRVDNTDLWWQKKTGSSFHCLESEAKVSGSHIVETNLGPYVSIEKKIIWLAPANVMLFR